MGKDLRIVQRDGYTALDVLSDVGGLQGILSSVIAILLGLWNYSQLDFYVISQLYQQKQDQKMAPLNNSNESCSCVKQFFFLRLCSRSKVYSSQRRKYRLLEKASSSLDK